MLLRFAVSNHLSIKDTQELSFIKSALKGPEEGLLSTPALPKDKVLPAAIIYGPNASGKSNLVDALEFMQEAVLFSHRKWDPEAGVPRKPFLLSKTCEMEPSRFEVDFDIAGVRYSYGFSCTSTEFSEEWLYSSPIGHQRMVFERQGPGPSKVRFGSTFKGQKHAIAQLMRPNSLLLSAAAQNNHQLAQSIVLAILKIEFQNSLQTAATTLATLLRHGEMDPRIITFLTQVGTGITGHRRLEDLRSDEQAKKIRIAYEALWDSIVRRPEDRIRSSIINDLTKEVRIEFSHRSEDKSDVFFEADRESAGTRRLIPLLQTAMLALDQGNVCVIDEIDASLHTQVCEAIIALFTNPKTNPNGAQIIATTHDTNLFNAPNLRRDELWLVEKSPGGASEFYSLADVKIRDTDNFERGYLQGRYGAIPFAGSASDLVKSL